LGVKEELQGFVIVNHVINITIVGLFGIVGGLFGYLFFPSGQLSNEAVNYAMRKIGYFIHAVDALLDIRLDLAKSNSMYEAGKRSTYSFP